MCAEWRTTPRFVPRPCCVMALLCLGFVVTAAPVAAQSFFDKLAEKLADAVAGAPADAAAKPAEAAGYLGLAGEDGSGRGVTVLTVRDGSPADLAGIRPGDLVTTVNGMKVIDVDSLAGLLGKMRTGDTVDIGLTRDGKAQQISVKLGKRPEAVAQAAATEPIPAPALPEPLVTPGRAMIGMSMTDLTPEIAVRQRLTARQGALIDAVQPGSPADQAGLPVGGVIVSFDGRAIRSTNDFLAAMQLARAGQQVTIGYYLGDRLFQKQVRLASADAPLGGAVTASPATGGAGSRTGPLRGAGTPSAESLLNDGGRRPALGRLGRVIDQFVQPAAGAGAVPGEPQPVPSAANDVEGLRRQVEALQRQVELLQQRLDALERNSAGRIRF